ncbi:hypothetical protein [Brevundimonas sp. BAL450]|uniref:hypothetical protein n=1 Tax=Brevundimonas sp. BAL450 TaxID=1708162 RepID=UPI001E525C02|nr:hypothetical protein [Brevundimonas sp. BAL450]
MKTEDERRRRGREKDRLPFTWRQLEDALTGSSKDQTETLARFRQIRADAPYQSAVTSLGQILDLVRPNVAETGGSVHHLNREQSGS